MSGRPQRVQDVLTCKLCTQYLRDPRQLPCGHTFCLACLERYYATECQRSETGRLRSPSVERRRRGLLPCPAAPVCLHVALVPDDGVAAFPVNQKIADIKERVVNEMAHDISRRMGRSHGARVESDTTSVCSDETDFSDVSCETTCSAPAAGSSDHAAGRSPHPNFAKFARYFEAEKDGSSGSSSRYTTGRSERRRVAISSSFQHRRRRVHTPSPAAFDDSTADIGSRQPSRCGSAPHLGSDGLNYRPTVRPRQGSSMASPLLRRARPTSCILEELADDQEMMNHFSSATGLNETPRRTMSTEPQRQPLFRDHVLPTHRENISTCQDRRSMPAHDESAGHGRHHSEDVKTGSTARETKSNEDEPHRHTKHHSEKLETGKNSSNSVPVPAQGEPSRHQKNHADYLQTGSISNTTKPVSSEANKRGKHSDNVEADSTSSSTTLTRAEATRNSKSQSEDIKTGKTSTSVSSRPGRRILPKIPTDCSAEDTFSGSAGRSDDAHRETTTSDVHQARQMPRTDKFVSTERNHASSLSDRHKDPDLSKSSRTTTSDRDKLKSSTTGLSDPNKSRSSTNVTDMWKQKSPDSRSASDIPGSGRGSVKSSVSDAYQTKPFVSAKVHDVDHSKSSVSGKKSSTRDASVPQKSQDSRKVSADSNTSQSKSAAASSKVHDAERVKSSQCSGQTTPDIRGTASAKSVPKDDSPRAGSEKKARQSENTSAEKSRSSKSTPGSGSRLTYKVNATTIQPVLMNSSKSKVNTPKTGHRSPSDTATDADENRRRSKETMQDENVEKQQQNNDVASSAWHGGNVNQSSASNTSATSHASPQNSFGENSDYHGSSGVGKDEASMPHSSQSLQTDVDSETDDDQLGTSKCHTDDGSAQRPESATDDQAPAAADAASGNEDAKNEKKKHQWQEFMATLQAARAKYSSTDTRLAPSETSRPAPVYSDSITLCWRSQRDDFAVPTSIAIAADGSAVVADVANCLLDFTDAEGNIVHSVTGTKPFSVVVGSDNNVYVGDRRSRTIRVFDIYGSDVAQWDAESTSFGWIAGIAALPNNQLAIIDRERCKVGIYTAGGERVTEFGSYGAKDAQLCMADFVAVDSHKRVIVSDSGNHRLKLFDAASGKLVANFAGRGDADGCLLWPKGVTVDAADRIIVADSGNDRICQFADDGRFISNLLSAAAKPYHVNCGGHSLLGVTHFALNGASQVDIFAVSSVS